MKILIVTNRIPYPLNDGGAICMHQSLKGYIDAGCDVGLLSFNTSKHFVDIPKNVDVFNTLKFFETVEIDNRIKLLRLIKNWVFSKNSYILERFFSENFEESLIKCIEQFKPTVIQFETLFAAYPMEKVKERFPNILLSFRMHNVEHKIWERIGDQSKGLRKKYLTTQAKRLKAEEFAIVEQADVILNITPEEQAYIKQWFPKKKYRIFPFSIESKRALSNEFSKPLKFYHLGSMDWLPNVEAMQRMKTIWKKCNEQKLTGSFDMAGKHLKKDAFEDSRLHNWNIIGEVKNANDFIEDKHILIAPLISGAGMKIKILEAMSMGRIVISTTLGFEGIGIVDYETGLVAESDTDFVQKIQWCTDHVHVLKDISCKAMEHVQNHFNLTTAIKNNLEFYHECC